GRRNVGRRDRLGGRVRPVFLADDVRLDDDLRQLLDEEWDTVRPAKEIFDQIWRQRLATGDVPRHRGDVFGPEATHGQLRAVRMRRPRRGELGAWREQQQDRGGATRP